MGRKRKFELGDVVRYASRPGTVYPERYTIVEYKKDARGRGRYRILHHDTKRVRWEETSHLEKVPTWQTPLRQPHDVKIYKRNLELGDRGCSCNCCIHQAPGRASYGDPDHV